MAWVADNAIGGTPLVEPVMPVPRTLHADPAKAAIGKRLFNDPRLSVGNQLSCATCHDLAKGGSDGRRRSVGTGGRTDANAPTVFNAALNFKQFWDGRADSLEAQVDAVVTNPVEMGSTWPDVLVKLKDDRDYRSTFAAAYPDGITQANVQNAIATYERTLITPNSRFDRYLAGDSNVLSNEEKFGYRRFKELGCVACHQGVNLGGNMFQKFGVMGDFFTDRAARAPANPADLGRFRVTGQEADRHVFKVPGLRNVALTAPYFHDGSADTLEDAVEVMFRYQLGRGGSARDKTAIVRFLQTLTGEPAR